MQVIDYHGKIKLNTTFKENIRAVEQTAPNHIALYEKNKLEEKNLAQADLLILSLNAWKDFVETEPEWLSHAPSILIVKE